MKRLLLTLFITAALGCGIQTPGLQVASMAPAADTHVVICDTFVLYDTLTVTKYVFWEIGEHAYLNVASDWMKPGIYHGYHYTINSGGCDVMAGEPWLFGACYIDWRTGKRLLELRIMNGAVIPPDSTRQQIMIKQTEGKF